MRISKETYDKLNELLKTYFESNAQADNFAYNLNFHYLNKMGDIYHHSFAHAFPSDIFADGLSDLMLKLGARPIRIGFPSYDKDYGRDVKALFADNVKMLEGIRELVKETIDVADMNDDIEVKIFLEDSILHNVLAFLKQSEEWLDAANYLTVDDLNIHFGEYTNFIEKIK